MFLYSELFGIRIIFHFGHYGMFEMGGIKCFGHSEKGGIENYELRITKELFHAKTQRRKGGED